jgi:hypothetical protein
MISNKKTIQLLILGSSLVLWFLGVQKAFAQAPTEAKTSHAIYVEKINSIIADNGGITSSNSNRRGLIAIFCKAVYDKDLIQGFVPTDDKGQYLQARAYTPKDSLFMFLLCNSLQWGANISSYTQNIKASDKQDEAIKTLQTSIVVLNEQIKTEQSKTNPSATSIEARTITRNNLIDNLSNVLFFGNGESIPYFEAPYLKKNTISALVSDSNCSWAGNLNNCSLSSYLSKVFNIIINDYTNSKIAWIYGYTKALSNNKEANTKPTFESLGQFSNYYFGECWPADSQVLYTNKEQIDGGDMSYCSHPNTYKVLSNFMENARGKVQNNVLIDYNILLEKGVGTLLHRWLATDCTNSQQSDGTVSLECGLADYQHLVLNELLYYSLFMDFYKHYVVSSEQFWPLTIGKDKQETQEVLDMEQRKSQLEVDVNTQAIQQDFKIIRKLISSFPIHIGLVAYLEDLVNFRGELTKLYTPIHQMYYKLRNTQTYR